MRAKLRMVICPSRPRACRGSGSGGGQVAGSCSRLCAVVKPARGWRRAAALFDCGNGDGMVADAKSGALRMLKAGLIGLFA